MQEGEGDEVEEDWESEDEEARGLTYADVWGPPPKEKVRTSQHPVPNTTAPFQLRLPICLPTISPPTPQ